MNGTQPQPLPRRIAIVIGLIAVCAGLLLPWLLPIGRGPAPKPATAVDAVKADAEVADLTQLDAGSSLLRLYAATIVILGLGVGAIFLYRRRLAAWKPPTSPQHLEVLGAVRIDMRSHVVLVCARGQKLLAGIDGGGLKLLVPVPQGIGDPPAVG